MDGAMPCRILVVDDDTSIREMLRTVLVQEGYQVSEAENGDVVLEILKAGGPVPDLILLDLMMPHHNGLALLQSLREDPEWQRIPVVVVSGAAGAAEQAAKFKAFCLPKPFDLQALLNIVECYCAPPIRPTGSPVE
jgi:DNA-binding response OmpR family regulator